MVLQNLLLLYEARGDFLVVFVFYLCLHFCFSTMIALNGRFQLEEPSQGKSGDLQNQMFSGSPKQNATQSFTEHLGLGLKAMLDPGSTLDSKMFKADRFSKPSSGREDMVLQVLQVIGLTFIPFALHNIILATMMSKRGEQYSARASASWFMARSMVIMSIDEEITAIHDQDIENYFSPATESASWQYHPGIEAEKVFSANECGSRSSRRPSVTRQLSLSVADENADFLDKNGRRKWRSFPDPVNERLSKMEKDHEEKRDSDKSPIGSDGVFVPVKDVALHVWCPRRTQSEENRYEEHTLTIHVNMEQKTFTFQHPVDREKKTYKLMKVPVDVKRYFSHVPRVSGLTWIKCVDTKKPAGTEIRNSRLKGALREKVRLESRFEFNQREWDEFEVSNLSDKSFISVDGKFFQPLSVQSWVVDLTLDLEVLPAQFTSYMQSPTQSFKCEECGHTLFESTDAPHTELQRVPHKCTTCGTQFLRSKCPECHALSVSSCPRSCEGDARASGSGAR